MRPNWPPPITPIVAPGSSVFRSVMATSGRERLSSGDAETFPPHARTLASCNPMILAARRAAFFAPATPMASVPTATPAGICAIESNESSPFNARDSTGTPSTGSQVCAAIMPGRWAAPPAPAMITCTPRSAASRANFAIRSGVRCAETIRCSLGTPSRSSSATQCCIVSQSEALPITTLTRAGADIFFAIKPEAHPFSRSARIATPFLPRTAIITGVKPRNPVA